MTPTTIDPQSVRLLAAEAICAEKTVRRAYRGDAVKPSTITRLLQAANKLNLPPPPPQPAKKQSISDGAAARTGGEA